jgi:DNA-binding transcriptional ArsR family regulator
MSQHSKILREAGLIRSERKQCRRAIIGTDWQLVWAVPSIMLFCPEGKPAIVISKRETCSLDIVEPLTEQSAETDRRPAFPPCQPVVEWRHE